MGKAWMDEVEGRGEVNFKFRSKLKVYEGWFEPDDPEKAFELFNRDGATYFKGMVFDEDKDRFCRIKVGITDRPSRERLFFNVLEDPSLSEHSDD
ncbi:MULTISPECIES: hypothetical protein [unclassified Halomonas]|uniref:hypothetical protein n=1 Tax=unclassified Halomonas TaxID=2609666 RepID=UPI0020766AA8|nr:MULTISPECIES: hypothetical protein [unclassified Halomonas]